MSQQELVPQTELKKGFFPLYISKSIIQVAGGLFGVFLPVFLYEFFGKDIQAVALWYIIGSIIYVFLLSPGAMFMSWFGFRRSLKWGSAWGALFFVALFFADNVSWEMFWFLSIATITLHRIFHWVPYHIDFAKFTDKENRGKKLGLLAATTNSVGIFAPFIAGIIVSQLGFSFLFGVATVIYLLSIVPLIFIPRTQEKFSWSYLETWKEFFKKKRRKIIVAHLADGAEQSIGLVIWPIFIFELLSGDYLQMGVLTAFITGATVILQLAVGKYSDDKIIREKLLKYGSFFYATGWILKIFVLTAFHIFIADAYHRFMKIFMRVPFDAFTYESTSDNGHFVDELTVLNEMALHIGKILMLLAVVGLSFYFDINMTFILAAVASIFFNFVRNQKALVREIE